MNKDEILAMFRTASNQDSLKKIWKRMCLKLHPDKGGGAELFKFASNAYDALFGRLEAGFKRNTDKQEGFEQPADEEELSEKLYELIKKYAKEAFLNVELCGTWIWITGDTKPHSSEFKADNFRWSPKKTAWYFHEGAYRRHGKRHYSLDEIRMMHGSSSYRTKEEDRIR